ncbi:transmembrane protein, putative (macronuclear) [Tetrahymena thermophila SB210]|uniref:Transmembrane protein, putative n=1 Tax=Tetrahymena thermophila (strain SB210) TaxID=312017 RepID=Q248K1_TETTS|nr:transmembrane protein, putative [Tetrahymena thermophila SB210]EAS04204.2 transmembrane protein, putative [Tetrahymena thermophila SB210]|eukprot:XP_001024449.2 transmembrane protein, putative [Tetrahymena thermophila SB210]
MDGFMMLHITNFISMEVVFFSLIFNQIFYKLFLNNNLIFHTNIARVQKKQLFVAQIKITQPQSIKVSIKFLNRQQMQMDFKIYTKYVQIIKMNPFSYLQNQYRYTAIVVLTAQNIILIQILQAAVYIQLLFYFNLLIVRFLKFKIFNYLFFFQIDIYFIDRITQQPYQNYIGPQSISIVNFIYIEYLQQVALYCVNNFFAQIYIYDTLTMKNIQNINNPFSQNLQGLVLKMDFDYNAGIIFYLDQQGNIYLYHFEQSIQIKTNFKITEIYDGNEQLVSYFFNNITNDMYVYSTNSIYYIDNFLYAYEYESQISEPANLFATIPIDNQTIEFQFFNNDNTIFRYSKFNINFVSKLNSSQIVDLTYSIVEDTLIIALKDSILFYYQYESSNKDLSSPSIFSIQQIGFHKFLSQNVYLTYEKQIIHYDIQKAKILKMIQLDQSVIVTQHKQNLNLDLIFVGLSNGQVLQYDLNVQSYKYYSILNQNQVYTQIITIILDDVKQVGLFVTNGGIVLKIDTQNQLILEQVNLITLVTEQTQYQLVGFNFDNTFQRYFFFFSGQKWGYVWNTSSNKQEQYLPLPSYQGNKIKLIQDFIIISSQFQVNIYSLLEDIKLLTVIKKDYQHDQITDYILANKNVIIIFFIYKYEVFLIQDNTNILISQQQYNYPRLLGYILQQNGFLKIYGLHQTGVFENNYSLNIYQDNSISRCSISISGNDIQEIKQKISNIQPKQTLINTQTGQSTQNQQQWTNLIYLQISDNQFSNINQFISQSNQVNSQFILHSADDNTRNLSISNNTFQSYQKPVFQINDYDFQFINSTYGVITTFNQNTQQIQLQNVSISNQCIDNSQILIQNVTQVIINFLKISQLKICSQSNDQQQQNLLKFMNISRVYIYNLEISSNNFEQNFSMNIFNFSSIQTILIDKVQIQNNTNLSQFFTFTKVNNITISNINITANQNKQNNQQQQNNQRQLNQEITINDASSALNFFGCQYLLLNNLYFSSNLNIQLVQSKNQCVVDNILTVLYNDEIQILDSYIISNQIQNNNLFYIQNSIITKKNINYKSNQGCFSITQSQYVYIYQSTFENNISQNGGAIYFQNIQYLIEISQTRFEGNTALSSGGALYFQNIANCSVNFDQSTLIIRNRALIGGGLRIVSTDNNIQLPIKYPFYQNAINNTAELYGDNSASYLQQILIQNDQIQSFNNYELNYIQNKSYYSTNHFTFQFQSIAQVNNFQSGGQLDLKIYIIDNYKRQLSFKLQKLLNQEYPLDIENELKSIQISINNFDTTQTQLIGEKILNYNQYNSSSQAFQLTGLQIQGVLQTEQYLQIDSSIYLQSQQQQSILLIINFRKCEIGEIIQQQTQKINTCKQCSEGTYQLADPQSLLLSEQNNQSGQKNECSSCPLSAIKCQGSSIQLKNGYWRKNNFTDEILQCNSNVGSCQAENPESINYCSVGYIGPLCQECDTLGEIWSGNRFSEAFAKGICQECYEIQIQWVYLVLKFLGLIIYFLYTTFIFMKQFKYSQICYYLRIIQLLPISKNSLQDQSGFYLKIIINYYQLSSLLIPQPLILGVNINFLNNIFGQANRQLSLGIDCMVDSGLIRYYGKIVFYSLVQFFIPLILFIMILLIIKLLQFKFKKIIKNCYYFTFFHIFLAYFQISQISYFSKSLTCQSIGNEQFNPYDLTKNCNDRDLIKFIFPYSIIILSFWSILPLILLLKLKKRKDHLNYCKTKYNYGYYYIELKNEFYYWEFVRIYLKITLIYIQTLLQQDYQIISASSSLILIALYIYTVKLIDPFISKKMLFSETLACFLISFKIYLSLIQFDNQNSQIAIEVLIVAIDFFFFIYCSIIVIIFKANNQSTIVSKLSRIILKLLLPQKIYIQLLKQGISFKTYLRWKFVFKNISKIIESKAQQNILQITTSKHLLQLSPSSQFSPSSQLSQNESTKFQLQRKFNLKTDIVIENSLQKASNFRLLKLQNQVYDQDTDNLEYTEYSQNTEEKDPKKTLIYSFSPKQSILSQSIKDSDLQKEIIFK